MPSKPKKKKCRRAAFRFEIAVNGKRVCMAGSYQYGVLSLGLNWIRRDPKKRPVTKSVDRWNTEECDLRIGALTRDKQEAWEKVKLKEGDEITIRLLGAGMAEAPKSQFKQLKPQTRK